MRTPCAGWTEPLTAAGEPYYVHATVGVFSLVAFRAQDDGRLHKLWAWEVRCGGMEMAHSDQRVTLAAAQLAAEDAARALLLAGLAVLGAGMPEGFALEWDNPDKWAHAFLVTEDEFGKPRRVHLGDSAEVQALALGMLAAVRK